MFVDSLSVGCKALFLKLFLVAVSNAKSTFCFFTVFWRIFLNGYSAGSLLRINSKDKFEDRPFVCILCMEVP
jgi:hypothetical protein